jgi:uracil-DNA glycosylase
MSVKALYQYLEFLKLAGIQDIFIKEQEEVIMETPALPEGEVDNAKLLYRLSQRYANCQKCGLSRNRKNLVYGSGNVEADLMLIGEGPGETENKTGNVFVGPAGKLLDKQLHAINLTRQDIYIANIVKCQPPGNRDPQASEIEACMPYLVEQIEIIKPQIILLLGRVAAHSILQTTGSISKLRLSLHSFREIPVYVTYHPSALLRNEEYKRPTWTDLQRVRDHYFKIMGKNK